MVDAPRAPLGHLNRLGFALRNAADVDEIASSLLSDLVTLPDVTRVGLALSEGAGRRLSFAASDGDELTWCHIDAYDDVPLTTVVRTREPVLGSLAELGDRYRDHVDKHRDLGTRAIACWPLPGPGAPLGGLVVYYDAEQAFGEAQRRLLEAAARWTAEAVRRVRTPGERDPAVEAPAHPASGRGPEGLRADVLLDGDPQASRIARHFLRDRLAEWGVGGGVVDTALLCLSELVTNAVLHAGTSSELTVLLEGGELIVVVRDQGGSNRPAGRAAVAAVSADEDPLAVFGRGLTLVDALADRWGAEHHGSGTTAWFVLEITDAEASSA